jgi:subtilisin-like proprotein convertase family protein
MLRTPSKTIAKSLATWGMGVLLAVLALVQPARGSLSFNYNGGGDYTASSSTSVTIPDYPGGGVGYALNFGASGLTLANITVSLNITGGYNGDLYSYLASPNGTVLVLLNRVGASGSSAYGFSTAGMNVTLNDSGALDIHAVNIPGNGGIYRADGQNGSPFATSSLNANGGSATFGNTFVGGGNNNPTGTWTLFFADCSPGSISILNGFTVDITAVPEPVNAALMVFGSIVVVLGGLAGLRLRGKRFRS